MNSDRPTARRDIPLAAVMATPAELTDFAIGFMLTERLADTAADIRDIDVFEGEAGWIVRVSLAAYFAALARYWAAISASCPNGLGIRQSSANVWPSRAFSANPSAMPTDRRPSPPDRA